MADTKISALTNNTTIVDADIFPHCDDPAGTPVTKGVTATNLWANYLKAKADALYSVLAHAHAASDTTSGTFADARISASSVTQHIASIKPTESLIIAVGDETTALTTGTAKVTFRMPYAFTVTGIRASVVTAPTGGSLLTVDVNEGGTTIISTKLTFDASEKTTTTAATAAVISDSALADDAEMTVDIDQVGSTIAGAGLKVTLIGNRA